jgi:serine/threonine-protein kinase HipA
LPAHPFLADEEGVRLSLAGAQNKLPLFYDGEVFFIPWGGAPSSHILKTPIPHLENTVVNEAFCMNLARRVGLAVPAAEVVSVDGAAHYLVARYDRRKNPAGDLTRLHQEDFCQALGVPSDRKYEKEGGPGFRDCFDLVREWSSEPLPDSAALLRWALFNFLIGNADAHGKNIAFLYADGRVRLAPFYDLISTAVYERVNNKFAMRMGGEKDPRYLLPHHLERFSQEAGIGLRAVHNALRKLIEQVEKEAANLGEDFCARYESPVIISRILEVIHRRIAKARTLLI